ncbi:GDP-mannose transporter GONST2 isoform X2 [Gossypium australe]|uniref:GDP-mannose transporter GONST2 isoform X2 n=1 Tax=Gossypium australe TaxID=47621 RepID=A0A5B6UKV0_9ROSI|nr:GDP-mannose transporter GONST2 isoform X2 [Gossypium australe]
MAKFRQHLTLWQPRELLQDPLFKFPYLPGISLSISLFSRSFHYAFKGLYFKLVFLHTFGSLIFLPLCVPFQKSFSHSVFTSFACSFASVGSVPSFISNAFDWTLIPSFFPLYNLSGWEVSDMSNIKLDEVVCRDSEESELSSWNEKVTSDEKVNRVYEILNEIHKQGQKSLGSITPNVENGTLTDR